MQAVVDREGCSVDIAETFEYALALVNKHAYTVAVVDVFLSEERVGRSLPVDFQMFLGDCARIQPKLQVIVVTENLQTASAGFDLNRFSNVEACWDKPSFPLDEFRAKLRERSAALADGPDQGDSEKTEIAATIGSLHVVDLSQYCVVGSYARFNERVRSNLRDLARRVQLALAGDSSSDTVFLLWGLPGSGKTFLVTSIAHALTGVGYTEVKLAACDQHSFQRQLDESLRAERPLVCLIDECDTHQDQEWPCELVLPFLDSVLSTQSPIVVFLAGSVGTSMPEFVAAMQRRDKCRDLMSRVGTANRITVPSMEVGDRLIVMMSQILSLAQERGVDVTAVEKLALYYTALDPSLQSARQLSQFTRSAVDRMKLLGDNRLRFDHLFQMGDRKQHQFWTTMHSNGLEQVLDNVFVDLVPHTGPMAPHATARSQ
jgi:hypothetical protein